MDDLLASALKELTTKLGQEVRRRARKGQMKMATLTRHCAHTDWPYTVVWDHLWPRGTYTPPEFQCTAERKPHICPVCYGRGIVPAGFYETTFTEAQEEPCRSCQGTGIVWG